MATIKEQIQALYDEINKTQKNKATKAHIDKLKSIGIDLVTEPNLNSNRLTRCPIMETNQLLDCF